MAPAYKQGSHRVRVVKQGFAEGEYGLQFVLTVVPLGHENGYERTVYLSLTDADGQRAEYADKSIGVLKHLGFHGDEASMARLDPEHPQFHSFHGVECEAYCQHKDKGGKVVERWYINTPRSGGVEYTKPKAVMLKKLDSLFGKELKEAPPETAPQHTAPPLTDPGVLEAEAAATTGEDDIPF